MTEDRGGRAAAPAMAFQLIEAASHAGARQRATLRRTGPPVPRAKEPWHDGPVEAGTMTR